MSRKWADGPFKLLEPVHNDDPNPENAIFYEAGNGMLVVHLVFIRHLNSIYLQAPFIPAKEYAAFIEYILTFVRALHLHHHGEENLLFPKLEECCQLPGFMDVNIQQHHAFEKEFKAFETWISELASKGRTSEFDGAKCNALIDAFAPPLVKHLNEEIFTFVNIPKLLPKGVKPSDVPFQKIWDAEGKEVMGQMSLATDLTAFLMNHDVEYADGMFASFPPAPAPVKFVLRNVTPWWSASMVKFASCDRFGKPKELPYASKL